MLASDIALKVVQNAIKLLLPKTQVAVVESWQQDHSDDEEQIDFAIARAK